MITVRMWTSPRRAARKFAFMFKSFKTILTRTLEYFMRLYGVGWLMDDVVESTWKKWSWRDRVLSHNLPGGTEESCAKRQTG
jgi:hypothetical protein